MLFFFSFWHDSMRGGSFVCDQENLPLYERFQAGIFPTLKKRGEACDTVYGNLMSSLVVRKICNFLKKDPCLFNVELGLALCCIV